MSVFEKLYTEQYKKISDEQKVLQTYEGFNFFDNCMTTLLRSFSWKNIPDKNMPEFMPEVFLQYGGAIGFTKRDDSPVLLSAFGEGKLTKSGTFSSYLLVYPNGEMFSVKEEDCVIGYNNVFRMPYVYKVSQYAEKMTRAICAVDAALDRAIFPAIVGIENESQLIQFSDYQNNFYNKLKTYLVAYKDKLSENDVQVLNLFDNTKNDVLALFDVFVRYRNLFATTFGINNVEIQKRERLTQAEGSGNDEFVRYTLFWDMYDNRRKFVEKVKEKFGYELEIEINRDIQTVYQLEVGNEQKIDDAMIEMTKGSNIPSPGKQADESVKEADTNED